MKIKVNLKSGRPYTVKLGDTLWDLAVKEYKNGQAWNKIYDKNKKIIGSNPNHLEAGLKIDLP
jgi:nucleoid-associated protein YgaU